MFFEEVRVRVGQIPYIVMVSQFLLFVKLY